MKARSFIVSVLAVALLGGAWWWFIRSAPPGSLPAATARASESRKAAMPKAVASPGIAPPAAPPAPVSDAASASPPAASADPAANSDPQADLKTALPDMARLIRAGDFAGLYAAYTRPDKFDATVLQQIQESMRERTEQNAQDPQMKQFLNKINDGVARIYADFASQPPVLNAAGTEATYTANLSNGDSVSFTFVKVNGRWYRKPDE